MAGQMDARRLVVELLEEQALAIGGLIATHRVEDEFVWRLFRSLDASKRNTLRRVAESGGRRASSAAVDPLRHPAVEEFLLQLDTA